MKTRKRLFHARLKSAVALIACALPFACSEHPTDALKSNQPPVTHLAVRSVADSLNATISKQTLHWWGDDPDGAVVGFIYTFNPNASNVQAWSNNASDPNWTFTEKTQETFTLTLSGTDTTYSFWVKAVDDAGAADPNGAKQNYPILNTRPHVEFPVGTDVPDTTFTVATFNWSATDLDGDDTIAKLQYVLDDTTNVAAWKDLNARANTVTLTAAEGLTNGPHVFYLRAVDIAGATSSIIRMPRTANETWYVRAPQSKFLVIDDYNIADNTASFYHSHLRALVGTFDVWDIKSNNSALEPPSAQAFTQTLQLFDRVLWYADAEPNLEKAQVSLPEFIDGGGKIIMTTSFQEFASNQGDPLEFAPVDSLGPRISRITRNQLINPSAKFASQGYPQLRVNTAIIPNVFPLVPKISADTLYVLPASTNWPGTPVVGVTDAAASFVFFGVPLAQLDGLGTVRQLFEKLLLRR
ncbi:hypothetical protein HUU05_17190 [candidate division KSB1 bacterium]|nr:hypothetical protein [candidate division KSB1 bacterium]